MAICPKNIPDEKLFDLCRYYGLQARLWRQKFIGLLPEVCRRKLHEKKGYGSIFEFAAKLGGLSQNQVKRVFSLEKIFENTPILKNMLENGEASVNKLSRVSSIATPENETFLADQVKLLSQKALETLVRDERQILRAQKIELGHDNQGVNHLAELDLSDAVRQKLFELQKKGIDVNTLLLEFLEKHELEIAQEKEKLVLETGTVSSRYIPVKIKRILKKEFGEKCSLDGCHREARIIHHTQRFSLSRNHNPKFLAPLCSEHHTIAHAIDVKVQKFRFIRAI